MRERALVVRVLPARYDVAGNRAHERQSVTIKISLYTFTP